MNPRDHANEIRRHLAAIDDLTGRGRKRGLSKRETEAVHEHANATRKHLTRLEIAAGLRPIGAALVEEQQAGNG